MLSAAISGSSGVLGLFLAYKYVTVRNASPETMIYLYISAVTFTFLGYVGLYQALSGNSSFQENFFSSRGVEWKG